jgi:hypothetical protein
MFPDAGPVQNISIGHWVALSGAAFGTGLGARNSLGFGLLAGLTNVRLGYWWDSHVNPAARQFQTRPGLFATLGRWFSSGFPVQAYLLNEWLARFHGPARRYWYLSDGGHFENTAVYELIRRRLPHIVCCDCGQDVDYNFGDLANLVRKARIDFNAEIVFYDRKELDALQQRATHPIPLEALEPLGTLQEFADGERRHRALLARICYEGEEKPSSHILFVKPVVTGAEPLDVRQYQQDSPTFPQESTIDQFFDEAQWESYRKLGEFSGDQLLGQSNGKWWFTQL